MIKQDRQYNNQTGQTIQ